MADKVDFVLDETQVNLLRNIDKNTRTMEVLLAVVILATLLA